jgi:hypothetical protein
MKEFNSQQILLTTTVGIDSIHIQIQMNKTDLKRFCNDMGCKYKQISHTKYQRKWFIFLADGEPLTAVYHFSSKTIWFEIGGLLNYTISNKHLFTQKLVSFFSDRKQSILKVDIAMDVAKLRDDLIVKVNDKKIKSYKRVFSTTYYNKRQFTLIVYDKSQYLGIFSNDLTRFELRLSGGQLTSWNVKDMTNNKASLDKIVIKVQEYFRKQVKIYSTNRLTEYVLKTDDVLLALMNFVAFLQGSEYSYKDHFKIKKAVKKRDIFQCWVKRYNLRPKTVDVFVKKRKKKSICNEISFDNKTLNKALKSFKGNPIFKNPKERKKLRDSVVCNG